MNIIIKCEDSFYKQGLFALLGDIFHKERKQQTLIFADYQPDTIMTADIIISVLRPGEQYICHPELYTAKPGLMIGLIKKGHRPARGELPDCLNQMILVAKDVTVEQMKKVVKHYGLFMQHGQVAGLKRSCAFCPHRTFTARQHRMIHLLLSGLNSQQIGEKMNIGHKTVLAHRNALMNKFRLRSDCDLVQFLAALKEKNE